METIKDILIILIKIFAILLPLVGAVAYLTYAERRVVAFIQDRIGPNRVGPFGFFQPIADTLKLFVKEIIIPTEANRYLYLLAPVMTIAPAFAAWAVIPFDKGIVIANIDVGLLYLFVMASIALYWVIIAGWASNSKYAFLGSLRSAAQMVSYEIPMGFAFVGVLMVSRSTNLTEIVLTQSGGMWMWNWLPLLPLFLVYFISAVAETNRLPFDVAEGESEIVAGFHVEYSGMTFALFFLAEYANMILVSAVAALLFMGGWLSPFQGIPLIETWFTWIPGYLWFLAKICFFVFLFLWFRATFPRFRYDQIMRLGWKIFIPVTLFWIIVVSGLIFFKVPPWFG